MVDTTVIPTYIDRFQAQTIIADDKLAVAQASLRTNQDSTKTFGLQLAVDVAQKESTRAQQAYQNGLKTKANVAKLTAQGINTPGYDALGNRIDESVIAPTPNSAANTALSVGTTFSTPIGESAFPNILHNYSSYTYNISLHRIKPWIYNAITSTTSNKRYVPDTGDVLISSAGRWDNSSIRNSNFSKDFFFDRLSMETIIGSTAYSHNANAINLEFTIIEPYGMTLINRLLDLTTELDAETTNTKNSSGAKDSSGSAGKNNIMQLPFMLQIDFFGYDDKGLPTLVENITKFIPIQIIGMKFKVSTKGTEYNISAVPYNHQAFSETAGTTPIKMQVSANSLAQFFASAQANAQPSEAAVNAQMIVTNQTDPGVNLNSRLTYESKRSDLNPGVRQIIQQQNTPVEKQYKIDTLTLLQGQHSYPEALNLWNDVNQKRGVVTIADKVAFTLDADLVNAVFRPQTEVNRDNTAMKSNDPKQTNPEPQEGLITSVDANGHNPIVITTINQGTSILNVISMAMLNSDYIHNQIIDPVKDKNITVDKMREFLSKPLNWFQVVPQIKLLGYDPKTNRYAKQIIYHIQKKVIYQDKNKNSNQGRPKVIAKDYEYLFTGKNNDILNFDLNFDTQFYVVDVANPYNSDITAASTASTETASQSPLDQAGNTILTDAQVKEILNDINKNGVSELKPRIQPVANIPTTGATRGSKAEMAKQLERNILTRMGGDMIRLTLKIVGDPDFIKQDDFFYGVEDLVNKTYVNAGQKTVRDNRRTPNGSLVTDTEDLFVRLTFKTPEDYDPTTGLAIPIEIDSTPQHRYGTSTFSGVYKITTVKNIFSGGKFEQELELYRYALQPTDGIVTSNKTVNAERVNQPTNLNTTTPIGSVQKATPNLDLLATPDKLLNQNSSIINVGTTGGIGKIDNTITDSTLLNQTKRITLG